MTSAQASTIAQVLILGALGGIAAYEAFLWALGQWATFRLWDPWVNTYPTVVIWVPFMTFALLAGLLVGALIALAAPVVAARIASMAAIVVCVIAIAGAFGDASETAGASIPSLVVGPLIAASLVAGAWAVHVARRA